MSAKAALAASMAWLAVRPIDGVADRYPYYAPLGAVVAVSTTVASSAREAGQTVLAILLGAGAAVGLDAAFGPNTLTIAAVVAIGTFVGGWRRLGAMGSWVPVAALFVLVLGNTDPGQYVAAYAGLVALGAAIGVGVNLVFPPLPLDAAEASLGRLRDTLAGQFDELAEALLAERPLPTSEWRERTETVETVSNETRDAVRSAAEAQRANWRALRWRDRARRQYEAAVTLEQLPFIVEDLTAIVLHASDAGETVPWTASLRPRVAHALQSTADLLRSIDGAGGGPEELATLDECLDRLAEELPAARAEAGDELFSVGSLITTLRRARASVRPREE